MIYLIIVSILWSFSFGIIKYSLNGVDSSCISFIRSLIALLFFSSISIYNIKKFTLDLKLILIGALQFGLMYIFYIQSYAYLPAYLIATFTITTPIFVGLASKYIARQSISKNGIYAISLVIIGSFLMSLSARPTYQSHQAWLSLSQGLLISEASDIFEFILSRDVFI